MKKIFLFLLCLIPCLAHAQKTQLVIKSGLQSEAIMASISPDKLLGLTVEENELMIIWELKTGRQLQSVPDIMAAGFNSDNKTIDVVTNKYRFKTIGYNGQVIKESSIVNEGKDKNNRLTWSYYNKSGLLVENGKIYTKAKGFEGRVMTNEYSIAQAYSEKLNLLAIPKNSTSEVQLCNVPNGDIVKALKCKLYIKPGFTTEIKKTMFSADGKYLLAANNFSLDVVDIATGASAFTFNYREDELSSGIVSTANFSPDGKQLLVLCSNDIFLFDIESRKVLWKMAQKNFNVNEFDSRRGVVTFSDDGKQAIIGTLKNLHYININNGSVVSKIGGLTNREITYHHLFQKESMLIMEENTEELKALTWNLASGGLQKITPTGYYPFEQHLSVNQTTTKFYKDWKETDLQTKLSKDFQYLRKNGEQLSRQVLSKNDKFIAFIFTSNSLPFSDPGYNKLMVADVVTKKTLFTKNNTLFAAFSNSSNNIAVAGYAGGANFIEVLNATTGVLIKKVEMPEKLILGSLQFSPSDKYLSFKSADYEVMIDLANGDVIRIPEKFANGKSIYSAFYTPDENYLVMSDYDGELFFYNIAQKQMALNKTIKAYTNAVPAINFTADSRYMFVNARESNVKLYDLKANELLATLYPDPETLNWAVVTPAGRFDASGGAQKNIYFVKGVNSFPLESLYEEYYVPKLLPRLLSGERFLAANGNIDDLKKAPAVKLFYAETQRNLEVGDDIITYKNTTGTAEITVSATAPEDKIAEIRLFHNGKVVNLATRGLFVTDNDGNETKKYTINLLPGNNSFRAIALNSQRTESNVDEIIVSYATSNSNQPAPKPAQGNINVAAISPVDKSATMYLMVVGINAYTNKINPLTYALPDATAFKDEIEKDAKSVLANIKTYFITDAKADKAGIINAFNEIKKAAKPQDVFVFYYAGHGYIDPANKEFYLVAADVADAGESLLKNGIPSKELQQYAVDIQAQKQLFILDACQSAGAFETMLQHDGEQQKSLAVVARSTGTHWMAASGSSETAKEFGQLGHGAFTYVLLQALKGQAAANKMITVNGMKNYLQIQVPELVKKYGSNNQYPTSYGLGNDFPVELIK